MKIITMILCLVLALATGCRTHPTPSQAMEIIEGTNRAIQIAVTRTWGELLSQKPLEEYAGLPEGGNQIAGTQCMVRVGIEAGSCAPDHGFLVYCLVQNWQGAANVSTGDPLGPLGLTVCEKVTHITPAMCEARLSLDAEARVAALFVKSVAFAKPGEYEIRLTGRNGRVLAMRTVKCEGEPEQPWMPWEESAMKKAPAVIRGWKKRYSEHCGFWSGISPLRSPKSSGAFGTMGTMSSSIC